MIYDQPHLYEIEDMIEFCKRYKHIYIYGCAENQEYLLKFFDICGIPIDGYVVTYPVNCGLKYRDLPIMLFDEVVGKEETGLLLGLSDRYFDSVIPKLLERNFTDYFILSEHNKRTIAHKLRARPRDRMWIEINLVDHCNLNCQMCDHFSQIADEFFLDIEDFRRDIERLAELSNHHIDIIKLQGGEPLLHKDVNRFVEITRSLFPNSAIFFFTNGLLLLNSDQSAGGNFWQCCKDNDVIIQLTAYPINLNFDAIEEKAAQYGVQLEVYGEIADRIRGKTKRSTKHPFNLTNSVAKHQFISCYHLNETITLRNGRLYTCSIMPYVQYFNKEFDQNLKLCDEDSIDIYKAKSYEEISEFVTRRVHFCGYCDIEHRRSFLWARSAREKNEYVDV